MGRWRSEGVVSKVSPSELKHDPGGGEETERGADGEAGNATFTGAANKKAKAPTPRNAPLATGPRTISAGPRYCAAAAARPRQREVPIPADHHPLDRAPRKAEDQVEEDGRSPNGQAAVSGVISAGMADRRRAARRPQRDEADRRRGRLSSRRSCDQPGGRGQSGHGEGTGAGQVVGWAHKLGLSGNDRFRSPRRPGPVARQKGGSGLRRKKLSAGPH